MSWRAGLLVAGLLAAASTADSLYKAALTQRGYIQFLKYEVRLPPLQDFTFCLWLKIVNFTYPQPIFSYSRNGSERLVRAWLEPARRQGEATVARLAVLEREVMAVVLPTPPVTRPWRHVCVAWAGSRGSWSLHVDGRVLAAARHPQMRGVWLPGGGDLVVGQEYTDADKGLDDGVEGEVFGFNLVLGAHHKPTDAPGREWADQELRRRGYEECVAQQGSPVTDKRYLLVSWARSRVALFGGVVVSLARPLCGDF